MRATTKHDGGIEDPTTLSPPAAPVPEETTSMVGRFEEVRGRWRQAIGPKQEGLSCPHCPESFSRPGYLALHKGRRHRDQSSPADRQHYEQVRATELYVMQEIALHTKCGFVALPIFLLWAATFVLLLQMQANVAWIAMSTPGYALFGGLIYAIAYGYLSGGRTDYYGRG